MFGNISKNYLRTTYDTIFRTSNNLHDSDSFYSWVFQELQSGSGKTLLDVACGSGRLLYYAQKTGLQAIGVDFSIEALRLEQIITPFSKLILADGQYLPLPDNSVDYVTNLGSLEHFEDMDKGVLEMARVLRPDGIAAIFLPNAFYLADLIWWVWRKGKSPSHKQPIERFAAFADWLDLLERNGLKPIKTHGYNFMFPRSRLDWEHYRRFSRKLLNLAIAPLVPFHFSYSFLYICEKAHSYE